MKVQGCNCRAQKERKVNSMERVPGTCSPFCTQTEVLRTRNMRPRGQPCSPPAPSHCDGSGNMTPPAWQAWALCYSGSAHHVSLVLGGHVSPEHAYQGNHGTDWDWAGHTEGTSDCLMDSPSLPHPGTSRTHPYFSLLVCS